MTDDPTRWLDDPTLSASLRADLAHSATATVTGFDAAAGLAALRGALVAETGVLAPAAASSTSVGIKAIVGVLAIGGAVTIWQATRTDDSPRVEPVAVVASEELDAHEPVVPRPAIPLETRSADVASAGVGAQEVVVPEPATTKRDDGRRRDAVSKAIPEEPASVAPAIDDRYLAEAKLVARARKSLQSDPAGTLALTDQIASEYPSGQLVEERRALAIRALAKLGRLDEAKSRAADFLADHAKGPHAAAVRRAIGDAP
jgi:hypothetical protein